MLSNLKLRLGYGLVGNDNIGTYKYGSTMQTMLSPFPGANSSYIPSNISNANLKWEASEQYNLGVDFGMINNRISLSVDLYQKDTKDLLLQVSTPSYMGNKIQAPYANIGKVRNRGVDIALNLVPVERPDFTWNSNIIVSVNRNEVLGLNDDSQVIYNGVDVYFGAAFKTASLIKVGQPIGVFYGYTTEGYFQNEEDVLQHAVQVEDGNNPGKNLYNKMNGVYTGDIKFKDLDDSGSIDAADQSIIGDPNPDFTYGWTNTFNYKNWELTVGLNGVVGGDILNIARYRVESLSSSWDNQSARMADRALIATDELSNDLSGQPGHGRGAPLRPQRHQRQPPHERPLVGGRHLSAHTECNAGLQLPAPLVAEGLDTEPETLRDVAEPLHVDQLLGLRPRDRCVQPVGRHAELRYGTLPDTPHVYRRSEYRFLIPRQQ